MKQTAVEWLVEHICTDVERYDEEGNVNGFEYWNAFRSCTDLSEYINQAKEMEKKRNIEFAKYFYELMTQKEIEKHIVEVIHFETFKK